MQVRGRVTRIIDEPSGKMLEFGSDCIKLEDRFVLERAALVAGSAQGRCIPTFASAGWNIEPPAVAANK